MSTVGTRRPPTLLALPSYLAGHVARIGRRRLEAALAERRLRPPHFAVLIALWDFGSLPQHELADRLGFNRSHLVGYLDHIEQHGLVHRVRDPADRRRQHVALTPSGQTLTAQLIDEAHRSQQESLAALSDAERQTLVTLLHRIVTADEGGPPDRA